MRGRITAEGMSGRTAAAAAAVVSPNCKVLLTAAAKPQYWKPSSPLYCKTRGGGGGPPGHNPAIKPTNQPAKPVKMDLNF